MAAYEIIALRLQLMYEGSFSEFRAPTRSALPDAAPLAEVLAPAASVPCRDETLLSNAASDRAHKFCLTLAFPGLELRLTPQY